LQHTGDKPTAFAAAFDADKQSLTPYLHVLHYQPPFATSASRPSRANI